MGPQQPNCFFSDITNQTLEVRAIEKYCSGCQRIEQMLTPVTSRIEDSAAIVVTKSRHGSRTSEGMQDVKHLFDCSVEMDWNGNSVQSSQYSCMYEEIDRIGVVVRRLFKVRAVGSHLALRFLQNRCPTKCFPACCRLAPVKQSSNKEQSDTLAEQMCIW